MSLINDALKRASQTHRRRPRTEGVQSGRPLHPVDYPSHAAQPDLKKKFLMPAVLAAAVCLSIWFFMQWRQAVKERDLAMSAQSLSSSAAERSAAMPPAASHSTVVEKAAASRPNNTASNTVPQTPVPLKPASNANASRPPAEQSPSTPASANRGTTRSGAVAGAARTNPAAASNPASPAENIVFPEIKIQAIFYRMKNSSILVNGATYYVGDNVKGAKITSIGRYGIEIEYQGRQKSIGAF